MAILSDVDRSYKERRADDISTRGAATFCGDTVAVAGGSDGATAATVPKLYSGKIGLAARFSKKQVIGSITELKDEGGCALLATSSDPFRKETFGSIALHSAGASDDSEGFYAVADASATVSFVRNLRSESARSTVIVQLLDEASEALGVWSATDDGLELRLEGSFGATRSGSVSAPSLPERRDHAPWTEPEVILQEVRVPEPPTSPLARPCPCRGPRP